MQPAALPDSEQPGQDCPHAVLNLRIIRRIADRNRDRDILRHRDRRLHKDIIVRPRNLCNRLAHII